MYETGLTARKIATFDNSIFNKVRELLSRFDWTPEHNPNKYLRTDGTYLLYLPNNAERMLGFWPETKAIGIDLIKLMVALEPSIKKLLPLTGISNPVAVQVDIAHMPPVNGDTVIHTDTRMVQRYARRYNIAIITNPGCYLYHNSYDLEKDGVRDHIELGEMWELNNKIPHTAVNYGLTWRTHLVLDVMPREYWEKMLEIYPNPFVKVPNPQGKNHTYDYDLEGNLLEQTPFGENFPVTFESRR
jgi:hypothetical protein